MGSTSSIARLEAEEAPISGLLKEHADDTMTAPISRQNPQTPISPPPPFPPPPQPSSTKTSASTAPSQDEVDAPIFDKKAKEKILGKVSNNPTKTSETKTTNIPMNESDRVTMEKMKKDHPNLSGLFDKLLMFVSTLREDLGLKKDRDYLQNAMDGEIMSGFLSLEESERKHLADFLAIIGGAQVVYDSYRTIMTELKLTHLNDIILNNIKDQNIIMWLICLRGTMWNYSDSSLHYCEKLGNTGMFDYLVEDLKILKKSVENPKDLGWTFESCMGILHNTSKYPGNRTKLRSLDTAVYLLPFLKCDDTKVKMVTLLTLAYLLHESQNHLLLADDSVFDFTLSMIKRAMRKGDHRYDGFSVQELVEGLTGMVKNDDNKKLLVKKGAVPELLKIMQGSDNDEKYAAVSCMWELSFDKGNRTAFHDDEEIMKLLRELKNSGNKKISKAASGALWEIHLEDIDKAEQQHTERDGSGHIMISYQWADQKKLVQIKESLRSNGYRVWMDVDNMGGSTLQAMAEAVQNASVVLVCMSERYKESQNCRSEAEYAFSLKKNIVPLLMERGYNPDGWLGMIKGTKLFFDFSGKYEFEAKVKDLMRELADKGKGGTGIPVEEGKIPVIRAGPVDVGKGPGLATWSTKDVHNWLNKSKVTMNTAVQKLTGEQLMFLRKLSHRAPEFYYAYIERKLQLDSIEDMMNFSTALDSL